MLNIANACIYARASYFRRAPRAEIARPRIHALESPFPHAPLSLLPSPPPSPLPLPLLLPPFPFSRHHRRCRCRHPLARRCHRRLFPRRFQRWRFPVRTPAALRRFRLCWCCCCCCCSTPAPSAIPGIEFQGWRAQADAASGSFLAASARPR